MEGNILWVKFFFDKIKMACVICHVHKEKLMMVGVNLVMGTEKTNYPQSTLKEHKKTNGHKRALTEPEYKLKQLQKGWYTKYDEFI